jgi:hypothetical protein
MNLTDTPFARLVGIADRYGALSFDNYSNIRSLAERLRDGFCKYLSAEDGPCLFLVPPSGPFTPMAYASAAFSVSGNGFLPLAPISFGLAVRVSLHDDWLRVVFGCSVEGSELQVYIEGGDSFQLPLPLTDAAVATLFDPVYRHIYDWFHERVEQYEQGSYGSREIGFEIINAASEEG